MQNNDAFFTIDFTAEPRLVFTTSETFKALGDKRPLWWYQPRSMTELNALAVWLGEHRDLWPAWRDIAQEHGNGAIDAEISRLWSEARIEQCTALRFSPGDDQRDVAFTAVLVTRDAEIGTHRFKTAACREEFMRWHSDNPDAHNALILLEACLVSRESLAALLDRIAEAQPANRQPRGHRRGRGRPITKAA